ncbi:hypothetical protein SPRG_14207 [Saprolegnia parasitica CBS 223.65]|uniref:Uncharacterized protein n=1 Tax=Saprolegnia parasitica (strain CBS 223.65) TaxID=695850 RepID=A0A067BNI7_SAPPC|nr:hypothetical protein SPRG_14207 [Saprolegnia parasitica CBS 223.65]KDO20059.1 hypothetical protein SPRG_14207 [Saprolegnia parasitica CBS 223.65]|eukprot:XP_012209220.1 hypothetical protein SPRG_14207 [Saprolegnia parasitica CBS 223.65]
MFAPSTVGISAFPAMLKLPETSRQSIMSSSSVRSTRRPGLKKKKKPTSQHAQGLWRKEEHERFLIGLQLSRKQSQTHMQKCKEKMVRKLREHNMLVDDDISEPTSAASNRCKQAASLHVSAVTPIPFHSAAGAALAPNSLVPSDEASAVSLEDSLDFFIATMPMGRLRL